MLDTLEAVVLRIVDEYQPDRVILSDHEQRVGWMREATMTC